VATANALQLEAARITPAPFSL